MDQPIDQVETLNKWTGLKGMIGGYVLSSPARKLLELFAGNAMPRFLELLQIDGAETIVDVGCGSGYYSIPVAQQLAGGTLIGVDGSPDMLRHLERRARWRTLEARIDLRPGTATSLPVDDGSADLVFTTNLLHELAEPELVVAEAHRVLRPGGRLAALDFGDSPRMRKRIKAGHHPSAHGVWRPDELQALFTTAGFAETVTEARGIWLIAVGTKPMPT